MEKGKNLCKSKKNPSALFIYKTLLPDSNHQHHTEKYQNNSWDLLFHILVSLSALLIKLPKDGLII